MARAAASRLAAAATSSPTVSSLPHPLRSLTSRPHNLESPRLTPSPPYQRELFARHLAAAAATAWTGPSRLPEPGENKKNLREMFDAFSLLNGLLEGGLCTCVADPVNWVGRERRSASWWCPSRSFHGEYFGRHDVSRFHFFICGGSSCESSCGLIYVTTSLEMTI